LKEEIAKWVLSRHIPSPSSLITLQEYGQFAAGVEGTCRATHFAIRSFLGQLKNEFKQES